MPSPQQIDLDTISESELLNTRLCDLPVSIDTPYIQEGLAQFSTEIHRKKLPFVPPCYLSDEWFSPEGEASIAIPFYLAHPRLQELEKKMMLEVEGGE